MKNVFTIVILIFCLASCKKEIFKTKKNGIVFDLKTNLPLVNVKVELIESDPGSRLGGSPWTAYTIQTTFTDDRGNFFFEFNALRRATYLYHFSKDNYYYFDADSKEIITYLAPYSYYKLHLKNVAPFNQNDKISFGELIGMNVDTFTEKRNFYDESYIFTVTRPYDFQEEKSWTVKKNGITTYHDTTIVGILGDTVIYDIFY